jgi:type I restriction enzyme S subunit
MSFPRYPAYKPSGVEWLGEVPEHWEVKPLEYIITLTSGGTPSKENLSYWNGSIPVSRHRILSQRRHQK